MTTQEIAKQMAVSNYPYSVLAPAEIAEDARTFYPIGFHASWEVAEMVCGILEDRKPMKAAQPYGH